MYTTHIYIWIEILVVSADEHHEKLTRFLLDYVPIQDKIKIELVTIATDNISGSADYLRAISNKIHDDFIVITGDMVTEVNLARLTILHRLKASDLAILLTPYQGDDDGNTDPKGILPYIHKYHTILFIILNLPV